MAVDGTPPEQVTVIVTVLLPCLNAAVADVAGPGSTDLSLYGLFAVHDTS